MMDQRVVVLLLESKSCLATTKKLFNFILNHRSSRSFRIFFDLHVVLNISRYPSSIVNYYIIYIYINCNLTGVLEISMDPGKIDPIFDGKYLNSIN